MKDGQNWYIYCSNNPLRYVDPSGLAKIYYDQTGNEINRENYWWMFWDKHFVLGNDGKNFWPIQGSLKPGDIDRVVEDGDEIFDIFVQANAPTSWQQKIFPLTVNEVLKNSPSSESWDIKRGFRNSIIILNGKGYREDMFGNITWGYLMASRGWPSGVSKKGAGIYQNYSVTSSLKFWLYNMVNFGDDPRDSYAIDQGYNLFYRDLFGW